MAKFSRDAAERVARATREVERRMHNLPGERARWFKHKGKARTPVYEITLEAEGKQDTIQWDATVGAFYVWGKPVLEAAEPIVIDDEADVEKLWITAQYRDQERRVDGLSSFAVGHRVYTQVRNGRREITAPIFHDPRWEFFKNVEASTAEHGYVMFTGDALRLENVGGLQDGPIFIRIGQGCELYSGKMMHSRMPMLNSPRSVGNQDYGRATYAIDRPFWAAVDPDVNLSYYNATLCVGPIPGSWLLWPGLPGFVSLGHLATDDDGKLRLVVMRDLASKSWWAVAAGDWVANGDMPYVDAHPCVWAGASSIPYDGSGAYPNVDIRVVFYKMGTQQDPNIHAGDVFLYAPQSTPNWSLSSDYVAVGPYLDGFVGEIRFLLTAKRGWALADGTANSVVNGGTGIDYIGPEGNFLRFGTAGGWGGLTHTHAVGAGTGLAAGSEVQISDAGHLPPYKNVLPYERIH